MAWLRIDDRMRTHPKIAKAGPAAAWLWLCGVCYCREHLTDGHIPAEVVPTLAMNLPSPRKYASRLVDVGLWEISAGGFQVHDFLDWNPSKADVLSQRDKERDKKRTQRSVPEGQGGDTSRVYAGERAGDRAGDAGLGSLSGSPGLGSSGESAKGGTPANLGGVWIPEPLPAASPGGLIDGRQIRQHGQHAWCSWPKRDGLCVPLFLHREFTGKLGRSSAEADLLDWYPSVVAGYEGVAIGDDALAFWRHAFAAWVGTVTSKPASGKADATKTAALQVVQRRQAEREQRGEG